MSPAVIPALPSISAWPPQVITLSVPLSPRLPSRGGKAPACRAWNLLSAHSWLPTAPGAQEGAFHHSLRLAPLPVPAKGHTSLVAVTRGGIQTLVHSSVHCFLFQTAIVPQLLGAVGHMQAAILPGGDCPGAFQPRWPPPPSPCTQTGNWLHCGIP